MSQGGGGGGAGARGGRASQLLQTERGTLGAPRGGWESYLAWTSNWISSRKPGTVRM